MNDITQKKLKNLEAARNLAEQKYHLITSATIDAIIMITPQGKISFWNPAAEKIFGYKKHEIMGKDLHLIVAPGKYHAPYKKGFETFKLTGKGPLIGRLLELTAIKKNGTEFPIGLSLSAAKVDNAWISIGIVRDITQRKIDEKALQNAHMILEKTVAQRTVELKAANAELSEANVALKILLKKSSEQGNEIEKKVLNNLDNIVLPYLEELLSRLKNENDRSLCLTIQKNLELLTSSFGRTLSLTYRSLTPREIQVADLIRHGRSTKEMAQLLGVSGFTIETYRGNLRKKFDLKNKKMNLRAFLNSIRND
ncbi:MAG: PAS domain S-box protein [Proteobacteria bacterium]|nr:PAS domain S-box protein [Pseudomonadota bacterium]MBU1583089.1 PAS domain S-box protein [Pseudomonadota bacterium]MBU2455208.1 PAS domain S-box protein [Pseudomonadota bacterium]MBU2630472.1 PAS domain S-box protein [Pseudomonadota bacterium]